MPRWPEPALGAPPQTLQCDAAHGGELLATLVRLCLSPEGKQMPGYYHIVRCSPCQLIHAWPLPDDASLTAYYAQDFYGRSHRDYLERYEQDRAWWIMTHHTILMAVHAALDHTSAALPASAPRRLLDVGTGPGIALDTARSLGFQTTGLELDVAMAAQVQARQHVVYACALAEMTAVAPRPSYDVIYAYEVLEHQSNPEAFVLQCWQLLAPGGVLAVTVPNDFNPLQIAACRRYGLPTWWIEPPEHLHYFTPESLRLLLRRCGFDLVSYRSTFPLESFMFPEQCPVWEDTGTAPEPQIYIGHDTLGRACHRQRMQWEMTQWQAGQWAQVERRYTTQLRDQGIGRELVAISRKRE